MTDGGYSKAEGLNLAYQGLVRDAAAIIRRATNHGAMGAGPEEVLSALAKRLEGWSPQTGTAAAMTDVYAERVRQVEVEGWTAEHDDAHSSGELALAGAAYARGSVANDNLFAPSFWPWDRKWWKPGPPRRMLVKAAALLIAEIERIDRLADRDLALQERRDSGE